MIDFYNISKGFCNGFCLNVFENVAYEVLFLNRFCQFVFLRLVISIGNCYVSRETSCQKNFYF